MSVDVYIYRMNSIDKLAKILEVEKETRMVDVRMVLELSDPFGMEFLDDKLEKLITGYIHVGADRDKSGVEVLGARVEREDRYSPTVED